MWSGFKKQDSTSYQLTRLLQQWFEYLNTSKYAGIIFSDWQKAFDMVWHKEPQAKAASAGKLNTALQWFQSYLLIADKELAWLTRFLA